MNPRVAGIIGGVIGVVATGAAIGAAVRSKRRDVVEDMYADEPFGALDVQTKEDMQVLVRQIWLDTGTTVLMVTHDVEEAVFLGQRVVVLASDPGRVAADISVDLPRDRDLGVKRTPGFLALRATIEDLVRAQHRKGAAAS
ncbi:hypothetical protein ACFQ1S_36910 [Kibdelosporangium lantanae]|uniref:Uncharacterized protein n=1 Tax=Kibdelosporangium lantanae TaxID=1497396 RepID=A0ABW3MJE3_9PSEU